MGLIRYLIFAAVGLLAYLIYRRILEAPLRERANRQEDERLGRLVQDPQCMVYVDPRDAVRRKVRGGELFFCSESCAQRYLAAHQGG